jgi:hypothetical protein
MRAPMPSVNLSAARLTVSILQPNSCSTSRQQQQFRWFSLQTHSRTHSCSSALSRHGVGQHDSMQIVLLRHSQTHTVTGRRSCHDPTAGPPCQGGATGSVVIPGGATGSVVTASAVNPHLDHPAVILPGVGHVEHVEGGQLIPSNLQTGNIQQPQLNNSSCLRHTTPPCSAHHSQAGHRQLTSHAQAKTLRLLQQFADDTAHRLR